MIPEPFHFLRPLWLWALVPVTALLILAACGAVQQSAWRRIVDQHLLRHLMVTERGGKRRWPLALLAAGWILATVALAGPAWERSPRPTYATTEATVIALDLSRSMLATDVAPSRLARARFKLHDTLERLAGAQVGLVVYAEDAYVVAPLTDDTRVIREMIPQLDNDLMPGRGNRADRAIDAARRLLDQAGVPAGHVVLMTSNPGDDPAAARAAAERLRDDGHRLSVLAIGDESAGADGRAAATDYDPAGLQTLAAAGKGRFATLRAGDADVEEILARHEVDRMLGGDLRQSGTTADVWQDAGVWLVAVLLPLGALAFRRGWVAVLLLAFLLHFDTAEAAAATWQNLWQRRDQQAADARAAGRPAEAAELFDEPQWKAAARYESGDFGDAAASYRELPGLENQYNLGNALARAGDLEGALAAYDQVLRERDDHEDARFNRDLVQQLLDRQREQQQQQDEQSGGGQSGDEQSSAGQSGEEQADNGQSGADGAPQQQSQAGQGQGQEGEQGHDDTGRASAGQQDQAQGDAGTTAPGAQPHAESAADGAGDQGAQEKGGAARDTGQAQPNEQSGPESPQQAASAEAAAGAAEGEGDAEKPAQDADTPGSLADRMQNAMESPGGGSDRAPDASREPGQSTPGDRPMTEAEQRREQVLRRIPDDPGGLLRNKIRRRYIERRYARERGMTSW